MLTKMTSNKRHAPFTLPIKKLCFALEFICCGCLGVKIPPTNATKQIPTHIG